MNKDNTILLANPKFNGLDVLKTEIEKNSKSIIDVTSNEKYTPPSISEEFSNKQIAMLNNLCNENIEFLKNIIKKQPQNNITIITNDPTKINSFVEPFEIKSYILPKTEYEFDGTNVRKGKYNKNKYHG